MQGTDYTLCGPSDAWWRKTYRRSLEEGDKLGKIYKAPAFPGGNSTQQFSHIIVGAPPSPAISGNFTVGSGQIFEAETPISVENGATLTLGSGSILRLADSVNTYVEAGGTLTANAGAHVEMGLNSVLQVYGYIGTNGTYSNPVRFVRRDPAKKWYRVDLRSDGNTFDYTVFDGGNKTVEILSKNNTFTNSRFKNGWRGISSGYAVAGGRSSFRLYNVVIDSSTSVGLVGYHTDFTMQHSTVANSGQAGIWLTGAVVDTFFQNRIEGNGVTSPTKSGIEVNSGGRLTVYGDYPVNNIKANAYHEIYIASGGDAYLGSHPGDASNSIYDPGDASTTDGERFIYNGSSNQIDASGNYWGTTSAPPSGQFYGNVVRNNYITWDYATSGASGVPQMVASPMLASNEAEPEMAMARMQHFEVSSALTPGSPRCNPSPEAAGLLFTSTEDACSAKGLDLPSRMAVIRGRLMDNPANPQAPALLRMLYSLQMLDRADSLGEKEANMAVIAFFRERLTNGSGSLAGETAALLELRDAMFGERYDEAARMLADYSGLIESTDNRRQLLLEKTFLLEEKEDYSGALAAFEQFKAILASDASVPGYTAPDYSIVEATLRKEIKVPGAERVAPAQEGAGKKEAELPKQLELGHAYPNPFRNTAVLPLSLPEAADVSIEVYDLLGRRVAVLAEGRLSAGRQAITLDGNGLSSGLYLIRARVEPESGEERVFTRKVMLVK